MRGDVWVVFAGVEGGGAVGIGPQGRRPIFFGRFTVRLKPYLPRKPPRGKALTRGEASNRSAGSATQNLSVNSPHRNRQTRFSAKSSAKPSQKVLIEIATKSESKIRGKNLRLDKQLSQFLAKIPRNDGPHDLRTSLAARRERRTKSRTRKQGCGQQRTSCDCGGRGPGAAGSGGGRAGASAKVHHEAEVCWASTLKTCLLTMWA